MCEECKDDYFLREGGCFRKSNSKVVSYAVISVAIGVIIFVVVLLIAKLGAIVHERKVQRILRS